jgi:hypothetical protein
VRQRNTERHEGLQLEREEGGMSVCMYVCIHVCIIRICVFMSSDGVRLERNSGKSVPQYISYVKSLDRVLLRILASLSV